MRILLIGGTGFIGRHLIRDLIKDKHKITVLSRNPNRIGKEFLGKVSLIRADVIQKKSLRKISDSFDWAFYLAAAVSYRNPTKDDFYKTNFTGTRNVFTVLEKMSNLKKSVYVSSVGIYGPIETPPADENLVHKPKNDYEISKDQGEKIVWRFTKKGLPINIIRPTLVYGPEDVASGMFRLFKAVSQKRFLKIGKKEVLMHPVFIKNLSQALILSAKTNISGEDFIIGDRNYISLKNLAKMIASEFRVKPISFELPKIFGRVLGIVGDLLIKLGIKFPLSSETVSFMGQHRAYNINKAIKMLGYKPAFSTKEGIKKTAAWYQKEGIL